MDGDKVLDVQTIDDSSAATEPEVPQKTGYRFIDWDTDFNNVQQDLEVHAQFIKTWNVVFKNGDTIISEQTVDDGKVAVEPAIPVKEGYSFVGWDSIAWGNSHSSKKWRLTPSEYATLLQKAKEYGEGKGEYSSELIWLDNWNEYGEGHSIMPDSRQGFGYLEAIYNTLKA